MDIRPRGETPVSPHRQIANYLRAQIESGELPPGSRLPAEMWLVQETGTARTTVRRALLLLASEGLVYSVHAEGWFVCERPGEP